MQTMEFKNDKFYNIEMRWRQLFVIFYYNVAVLCRVVNYLPTHSFANEVQMEVRVDETALGDHGGVQIVIRN